MVVAQETGADLVDLEQCQITSDAQVTTATELNKIRVSTIFEVS